MKNKYFFVGTLIIALFFSLTITGLAQSNVVDSRLNGTWSGEGDFSFNMNNGEFEIFQFSKGVYSTNNGIITMRTTHIYGKNFVGLESRWYSRNEMEISLRRNLGKKNDVTDGVINYYLKYLDDYFSETTEEYSINNNELIMPSMSENILRRLIR